MEIKIDLKCKVVIYRKPQLFLRVRINSDYQEVEIGEKFTTAFTVLKLSGKEIVLSEEIIGKIRKTKPKKVDLVLEDGVLQVHGDIITAWAERVLSYKTPNAD